MQTDLEIIQKQKEEVDVLESIYLNDITLIKSSYPFKFEVICKPFIFTEDVNQKSYNVKIIIELVKNYPNSGVPKITFEPISDITQDHIAQIELLTRKIINRNQGNLMIFEIVEGVRDWIQTNIIDLIIEQNEQANEKQKIIYHRPTFDTYTPCTVENFLIWKAKFDDELNKLKIKQQKEEDIRLSGKQFFLKNKGELKELEPEVEEGDEDEDDEDYYEDDGIEYEELKE